MALLASLPVANAWYGALAYTTDAGMVWSDGTGWRSMIDMASRKRIRRVLASYGVGESRGMAAPAMSIPPSFTAASSFTLTGAVEYTYATAANRPLYQLSPGTVELVGGLGFRFRGTPYTDGSGSTEGHGTISWMTDAPYSVFSGPTTALRRLLINDRYHSFAGLAGPGSSPSYMIIDWSGVRAVRKYTLEIEANDTFRGVYVGPTDTLYPPPNNLMKLTLVGDSYCVGTTSDAAGAQQRSSSLVGWLRDLLGADIAPSASGGTGMTVSNGVKPSFSDPLRIAHVISTNPDVVYVAGSINDNTKTAAQLQTATNDLLVGIRAGLPGVPILVQGPPGARNNVSANMLAIEDGMSAAVTALADPLMAFIPTMRAAQPWMRGTGYQGLTNGTGNTDVLLGPDTLHPTLYGSEVLGRLMAAAIVDKLTGMNL